MSVIDTSVVLAVLLNEPEAPAAQRLIASGQGQVPDLLRIETANALVAAVRKGRLTADQVPARYRLIERLPVRWHTTEGLIAPALALALAWDRRPYDGVFVALAESLDSELLTLDRKLVHGLHGTVLAHRVKLLTE